MSPTVVIDPGHGGSAAVGGSSPNNAVGPNGLLEKDLTLDLARRVAALLSQHATVLLTRVGDENRSLTERARVARDHDASVFLSLHLNGWRDPSVDGSEAWVATHATPASRTLARTVLDHVVAVTHARDRGIREEDLGVLLPDRLAVGTAATLLEVAFLTNPDEASRLARDDYKQALAQAIASAITGRLAVAESLATTDQQDAIAIVEAFRAETMPGAFTLRRDDVADRAIALINDPTLVDQASLNLCGPAAAHRLWIARDPKAFARYVTSLYDSGEADFGSRHIKAGGDLRHQDYYGHAVPAMTKAGSVCPSADWVALSSLRDASNTFLDFEGMPDEDVSGITTPAELAAWLRATGLYGSVSDEGNWFLTKGVDHAEGLVVDADTDVAMLINAHILSSSAASGHKKSDDFILNAFPNHFVVLRSRVTEPSPDEVEFDCWTWGSDVHVRLSKTVFGANYYGAVIARVPAPAKHVSSFALQLAPVTPVDGVDVDSRDPLPSWDDLRQDTLQFAILKATQGTYFFDGGTLADSEPGAGYPSRSADARRNHFLVGAYHYGTAHEAGHPAPALADAPDYFRSQADFFADHVGRVLPGDLPPCLDFEHKDMVSFVPTWRGADWRDPLEAFLDRLETRLGRVPMIYTSDVVWTQDSVGHAAGFERFGDYPLWVKQYFLPESTRYAKRRTKQPDLPPPWSEYAIWQYSGDFTPAEFTNLTAVRTKTGAQKGIDANVASLGIHFLRGLAGLGRPAPFGQTVRVVIRADENGELMRLTRREGAWDEDSLTELARDPNAQEGPRAAGDVAACEVGDRCYVAYRSRGDDGHLYETVLGGGVPVTVDLTGTGVVVPAGDPTYLVDGTDRALAFWGDDNHVYLLLNRGGAWQAPLDVTVSAGLDQVSGEPALYASGGNVHVVGRAGTEGHLWDAWHDGTQWNRIDLTDRAGAPAATYRPTTYTASDGTIRIVYRALRGHIHQIDQAFHDEDLSQTTSAPTCAGNPAAFVLDGTPHIVYRQSDGILHEIAGDGAGFKHGLLPCAEAAADPGVSVGTDGGAPAAFVAFRGRDGGFHQAKLQAGAWSCQPIEPSH